MSFTNSRSNLRHIPAPQAGFTVLGLHGLGMIIRRHLTFDSEVAKAKAKAHADKGGTMGLKNKGGIMEKIIRRTRRTRRTRTRTRRRNKNNTTPKKTSLPHRHRHYLGRMRPALC
jgi:hypothetical protein